MSTELSCETHVARGATVTLHFWFTLISYHFVTVVRGAALLPKLWVAGWMCGFGMCAAEMAFSL